MPRAVSVTLAPGAAERGVWCSTCSLSTAVRIGFALIGDMGVRSVGAGVFCIRCGAADYEEPEGKG